VKTHQTLKLPTEPPIRTEVIALRCTMAERDTIFAFAKQLDLPVAEVVRQYVLQAAALYQLDQHTQRRQRKPDAD
jgi:hypothetical protein